MISSWSHRSFERIQEPDRQREAAKIEEEFAKAAHHRDHHDLYGGHGSVPKEEALGPFHDVEDIRRISHELASNAERTRMVRESKRRWARGHAHADPRPTGLLRRLVSWGAKLSAPDRARNSGERRRPFGRASARALERRRDPESVSDGRCSSSPGVSFDAEAREPPERGTVASAILGRDPSAPRRLPRKE